MQYTEDIFIEVYTLNRSNSPVIPINSIKKTPSGGGGIHLSFGRLSARGLTSLEDWTGLTFRPDSAMPLALMPGHCLTWFSGASQQPLELCGCCWPLSAPPKASVAARTALVGEGEAPTKVLFRTHGTSWDPVHRVTSRDGP